MNLYEGFGSNPSRFVDPTGEWNRNVHEGFTTTWAEEVGMRLEAGKLVGKNNIDTDGGGTGYIVDQPRHFNRSASPYGADTRLRWVFKEVAEATSLCSQRRDDPLNAALHFARALHSLQDWWAHGDYSADPANIKTPFGAHFSKYDKWGWDAHPEDSIDGRPPKRFAVQLSRDGQVRMIKELRYDRWVRGDRRKRGTERDSKEKIVEFLKYIRDFGGPKCRCFFLEGGD